MSVVYDHRADVDLVCTNPKDGFAIENPVDLYGTNFPSWLVISIAWFICHLYAKFLGLLHDLLQQLVVR